MWYNIGMKIKEELSMNNEKKIILHVDMDAFYASIEMRDNPELKSVPLIIGAKPEERGVVSTCNYKARKYGVHSGMNIKEAYRLCPHGTYMHPDFYKYKAVSNQLHEIWSSYTDTIEYIAFDEAFLDLTDVVESFDDARALAYVLKSRVLDETSLTCSVGIGYSKSSAKLSSEENKPDGYFEILTKEDFINLVSDRGVRILPFVGPKTEEKLNSVGIIKVSDISANEELILSMFGKHGEWMVGLSRGTDNRPVETRTISDIKSVSREVTFQTDTSNRELLKNVLLLLSVAVCERLKSYHMTAKGVSIKVTYYNMKKSTRQKKFDSEVDIYNSYMTACELLDKIEDYPIRLIGFKLYDLSDGTGSYEYSEEVLSVFSYIGKRYNYDFLANKELLKDGDGFHSVTEYMRKYEIWANTNGIKLPS